VKWVKRSVSCSNFLHTHTYIHAHTHTSTHTHARAVGIPEMPSLVDTKPLMCDNQDCQKPEAAPYAFQVCASCHIARYCGTECQRIDWVAGHNIECAVFVEMLEEETVVVE
jgi:hypothetical protein